MTLDSDYHEVGDCFVASLAIVTCRLAAAPRKMKMLAGRGNPLWLPNRDRRPREQGRHRAGTGACPYGVGRQDSFSEQ